MNAIENLKNEFFLAVGKWYCGEISRKELDVIEAQFSLIVAKGLLALERLESKDKDKEESNG